MKVGGFDWDRGNRFKNEAKHGLDCATIERFFRQPIIVAPDPKHSASEERFHAIGRLPDGTPVIVVFTIRPRAGKGLIRPISARQMNSREVERYEEIVAENEK